MHTWTRCRLQGMQVPNVHVPWLAMRTFFLSWKCRNVLEFPEWTDPNLSNLFQSWFEVPIKTFTPLFMFQTVHDIFQDWLQSMCGLQRWIHLDLGVRLSVGFRELGFQHQGGPPLVPVGNRMLLATRWPDVRLHARSNRNRLITSYNTESPKTCQLNTGPPSVRIRGIFIGKSWTAQDMPSRWYETWCAIWIRTWMGRSTRASWMKKKSTKLFRRASLGGEPSGTLLSAIWCCCYKYGNVGHYRNPHPCVMKKMENVSAIIGSIGKLLVFIPWHDLKALQTKLSPVI